MMGNGALSPVELFDSCRQRIERVNPAVNAILVDALVAGATSRGARRFLDLFCGAGNFALPLGREGLTGVGIESNRSAIAVASKAAAQQGLAVRFRAASVVEALAEPSRLQAVDLVVLDPPRAGASDEVAGIVALEPQWIAYVSCDPATLARDLRTLVDGGYRITEVTPFDMFPHTHHVETLVWLQRGAFDQSGDAAGVELSEGDAGSS